MSTPQETWRVSTVEGIFETDLETLKQWIVEGCVLPTDKVSKGTLNWIDAGRVPKLKKAFDGEIEPPAESTHQVPPADSFETNHSTPPSTSRAHAAKCHNHPDLAPTYICRVCEETFCNDCPRFIGSSKVAVCPLCGDLCKSYSEVSARSARAQLQRSGFGIEDFVRAIAYPLQHKGALLAGALLYGFLMLAGFRGGFIAWMIMFGCISHVINQVAWGRLDRSFMPDLSACDVWEDIVRPVFLGVAITIVTWGPTIAVIIALVVGVAKSGVVNPTPVGVQSQQSQELSSQDLEVLTDPEADPKKLEEANRKLNQTRPGSVIAKEAERSKNEASDPAALAKQLAPYLGAGIFLVLLLLVAIAWAIFYYPMALTVAGYTQAFFSVLNPLVGLDTIRRMRSTYFKAFGMVLLIQLASGIVGWIVAVVTSPFALPFTGNLPANFIGGAFTFYFNLVIACLLGLSLFKCADRLGINVD